MQIHSTVSHLETILLSVTCDHHAAIDMHDASMCDGNSNGVLSAPPCQDVTTSVMQVTLETSVGLGAPI